MGAKIFLLIVGFLLIHSFGSVSADFICVVTSSGNCNTANGDTIVMRLSDTTNAHGQLNGQTPTYPQVLCCQGFAGQTTTCNTGNKIIGLSADNNAHAEIPSEIAYTSKACYTRFI